MDHTLFRPARVLLVVAALLMVPLIAMQFDTGVNWSVSDFIVAGTLLAGTGLLYQLLAGKAGSIAYRAGAALALFATLSLVWVNLAVGFIGSEQNPANLMYLGVLAVGVAGAVLARLQPVGMARALFAMAGVQALIGVVALALGLGASESRPLEIVGTTAIWTAMFAAAGMIFRSARSDASPSGVRG
jgi:hypothetical protein